MEERKQLFLCNSVYQVMVALWLKHRYYRSIESDIIISNHMNGGREISERVEAAGLFRKTFYGETLEESRYRVKRTRAENIRVNLNQMVLLKQYVALKNEYTDIYLANFDGFSQLLFTALSRGNVNLRLHVFEDGISTYCDFKKYYEYFRGYYYDPQVDKRNPIKRLLHQRIYKIRPIYNNITDFYVFNPQLMKWNPGIPIYEMDKIDRMDEEFRLLVRQVFAVDQSVDHYDRKYIFFEESFFADGDTINDVELVEQLVAQVGKENIMIKIHPRNPVNRFAELGYKTNTDTSIPWEVILMNLGDVSNKVFLTVASSAILNPIMIFGTRIKAYSLFPCLKIIPKRLQGEAWAFLKELFLRYPDMITLCDDISTIK